MKTIVEELGIPSTMKNAPPQRCFCELCGERLVGHSESRCKQITNPSPKTAETKKTVPDGDFSPDFSPGFSPGFSPDFSPDFNEAGRQLLERIGALPESIDCGGQLCSNSGCKCRRCVSGYVAPVSTRAVFSQRYQSLDEIWCSSSGGGRLFVGSLEAASDIKTLQANGITHVINCMNRPNANMHENVTYFEPSLFWLV